MLTTLAAARGSARPSSSPTRQGGRGTAKVKFKLLGLRREHVCFPPKTHELEATLKVLDGPAVPVDAKYKDEVEKAQIQRVQSP